MFTAKKLKFILNYGQDRKDPKEVTLEGFRATVQAETGGGAGLGQLNAVIYGVPPEIMNEASTIGNLPLVFQHNTITVFAGDENGTGQIFFGTLTSAYTDTAGMPEVGFNIIAQTGAIDGLKPVKASSYPGGTDAAIILQNLAKAMGYRFENNGVSVMLYDQYLSGTARSQALQVVVNAGIEWNGCDNGVLAIWNRGGHRGKAGDEILINVETGMKGSPTATSNGATVQVLFNPNIEFGALVKIESIIQKANGIWRVGIMSHSLSSEVPGGEFFTTLYCTSPYILAMPSKTP